MGEGCTPLIGRTLYGAPALLKCEWFMPTGSFKDRGASVMLSLLRAQGVREVLEDSSGNGGAAVSAYAAAGGLHATIMAPASTSPAKTVQMRAHGATVELIPGTRQDTADAAVRRSETMFYASHNWHPFFLHGTKTLAYELWEDLGFRAPDNIITPCGAGSNVLGCEIGFSELLRGGEIDTMPRIFAAQPANCGPIAAAFLAGSEMPVDDGDSSRPSRKGPRSRNRSGLQKFSARCARRAGGAVMLSEDEIGAATLDLARTGIYVEPTSAQAAGRVPQAAGGRRDHAGADHGAGADRQRAEGDAADRRVAGNGVVSSGSRPLPPTPPREGAAAMTLGELATPCLVLDRRILMRNIGAMASRLARHGVPLRPHMKTAKSIDVARLAIAGQPGGITVSTLAEAEYFAGHGVTDILYAVGITPQKLDQVARLNAAGADMMVLTDDLDAADAIAAQASAAARADRDRLRRGPRRGGAGRRPAAGDRGAAGHASGRCDDACRAFAMPRAAWTISRASRRTSVRRWCAPPNGCARRGYPSPIVSMGSSPTALHARRLDGVTEVRAGVYMFGDLFQAEIGTHELDAVALTVLTSVIGRRPGGCWWTPVGLRCRRTAARRTRRRITASAWCWMLPASAAMAMPLCGVHIRSTAWWRLIRASRSICRSAPGCGLRRTIPA